MEPSRPTILRKERPNHYLKSGEQTVLDQNLKGLARSLKQASRKETLSRIIDWTHQNLPFKDIESEDRKRFEKEFRSRTVGQIIKEGQAFGCDDYVLVFVAFCRACEIPARFVEGKRVGKSGGHVWAEAFVDARWISVDPTTKKINFDPGRAKEDPYKAVAKGLDSWDIGIRSWEDWKRRTGK